ncbi:hypothetical protein BJ138DRAFT_424158 [Hygrophoropsis aurantiaca]|uniref:Uncharacterized protein n=1 Tax=Hygrophoropsis aurantiaca TaxID=72124 RepID=A0ACB8A4E5_9AGAM|nr:hypothetical protein BJ138DRAFT_424158 [Hygrophoropsis aurantiaca]
MAETAFIRELQTMQTSLYLAAAGGALVAYDQILTFPQEVDHIWNQRWSFITVLYLIARYSGSLSMIGLAAWYMCVNWTYSVNLNMYLTVTWAQNIFLLAMQAILVFRVYALFNGSKKVLIFLATLCVLQAAAGFVMTGLLFNNRMIHEYVTSLSPAMGSVGLFPGVNTSAKYLLLFQDSAIPPVVFDTVLLLFALQAFVRHALEAKTLGGGWSINVLIKTLVADHVLYFVCNLTWLLLTLATNYASSDYVQLMYVSNVSSTLAVVAGPRMVISLRAIEHKTRQEGETLERELSTVRFGIREPPTQSESVMEEGCGFRAMGEDCE